MDDRGLSGLKPGSPALVLSIVGSASAPVERPNTPHHIDRLKARS
jgi:hypothetical protein